jgi:hypothetical protein
MLPRREQSKSQQGVLRFPRELREIWTSSLHVRILSFVCFFCAVEYQRAITTKLLQQQCDQ